MFFRFFSQVFRYKTVISQFGNTQAREGDNHIPGAFQDLFGALIFVFFLFFLSLFLGDIPLKQIRHLCFFQDFRYFRYFLGFQISTILPSHSGWRFSQVCVQGLMLEPKNKPPLFQAQGRSFLILTEIEATLFHVLPLLPRLGRCDLSHPFLRVFQDLFAVLLFFFFPFYFLFIILGDLPMN